jgi:hypothetical protein
MNMQKTMARSTAAAPIPLEQRLAGSMLAIGCAKLIKAVRIGLGMSVLSLGLLSPAADAALVRFNFAVDFTSGPLDGQSALGSFDVAASDCPSLVCTGTFTPSGPANPIVGPTGTLLAFSVVVDGITFTASSDDLYPDFPSIELVDSLLSRVDFMDLDGSPSLTIFGSQSGGWGGQYTNALADGSLIGGIRQIGDAQVIPEPATTLLVAGALLAGISTSRRRGVR